MWSRLLGPRAAAGCALVGASQLRAGAVARLAISQPMGGGLHRQLLAAAAADRTPTEGGLAVTWLFQEYAEQALRKAKPSNDHLSFGGADPLAPRTGPELTPMEKPLWLAGLAQQRQLAALAAGGRAVSAAAAGDGEGGGRAVAAAEAAAAEFGLDVRALAGLLRYSALSGRAEGATAAGGGAGGDSSSSWSRYEVILLDLLDAVLAVRRPANPIRWLHAVILCMPGFHVMILLVP